VGDGERRPVGGESVERAGSGTPSRCRRSRFGRSVGYLGLSLLELFVVTGPERLDPRAALGEFYSGVDLEYVRE
jgi:hypothetical protein